MVKVLLKEEQALLNFDSPIIDFCQPPAKAQQNTVIRVKTIVPKPHTDATVRCVNAGSCVVAWT